MDETSLAHTQLFINSSIKNREAEAMHKATQFPVDANGNIAFDKDGRVTKRKKAFKQNTLYFKAMQEFVLPEENPTLLPAYIEESNPERDNRTILYVKADIKPLDDIICFFSQAGQIKSMMISEDEILRKLSVEIEFYNIKSVAVAVALAVKNRLPNVFTKTENICVDSYRFPVEEAEIDRVGNFKIRDAFSRKIHIGFSHIPMTIDWLEKIFRVFDVVEKIRLPRPVNHVHLGHACLQFESIDGKNDALRLNKKLKFSYKNAEVKMEVAALDGTKWLPDGNLKIVREENDALRLNTQLKCSYKNAEERVKMEVAALDGTKWLPDGNLKIVRVDPEEDDGSL